MQNYYKLFYVHCLFVSYSVLVQAVSTIALYSRNISLSNRFIEKEESTEILAEEERFSVVSFYR